MRISLLEFQNIVREALQICFPDTYWVTAEMSDLRVASNGHCYLELLDKDERSQEIVAKARAAIWNRSYATIARKFEEATGGRLESGQRVLVQVSASIHELYGYSLTISDIDPSYTVGETMRRRQEILKRLEQEALLHRNASRKLPSVPRRIAIVSSETAAGYEDFLDQLSQNSYGFRTTLFPTLMQGRGVDESVIKALRKIEAKTDEFDAVVIIRGGGSSSDLSCFDSYVVAREIALFPLPVIVGIGHERDETVLDFVSHTRVKTPTAAAEFLIGSVAQTEKRLEQLEQTIVFIIKEGIGREQRKSERIAFEFKSNVHKALNLHFRQIETYLLRVSNGVSRRTDSERHRQNQFGRTISFASSKLFSDEKHRLDRLEQTLKLLSPDDLLRRGYTMTAVNGKLVTSVEHLQKGDRITTYFADGKAESALQSIDNYQQTQ